MSVRFPDHIKMAVARADSPKIGIYAVQNENETIYTEEGFFINLLSEALHFSFSVKNSDDDSVGHVASDGSWSGVFGMLQRGDSDLAINHLALTEERYQVVDFSKPYYIDDMTFLVHNPEPLSKSWAIFNVIEKRVWIAFLPIFLIACLIFHAMVKRRNRSFGYVLLTTFGSVLEQELSLSYRSWHKKLIVMFWIVGVMFLSYSYKSLLLSFLTFPPMKGIRTIDDLSKAVREGSYACATYKNSYVIDVLKESDDPRIRVIGESLEKNSGNSLDIIGLMKNKKSKVAIVTARSRLKLYQEKFYLSRDSFFTIMTAVALRKTFCCEKKLSEIIERITEAGLYEKLLHKRDLTESLKFISLRTDHEKTHILTVDDIGGVLLILIAGHILSCTVFLIEHFLGDSSRKIRLVDRR